MCFLPARNVFDRSAAHPRLIMYIYQIKYCFFNPCVWSTKTCHICIPYVHTYMSWSMLPWRIAPGFQLPKFQIGYRRTQAFRKTLSKSKICPPRLLAMAWARPDETFSHVVLSWLESSQRIDPMLDLMEYISISDLFYNFVW